MGFDKATFWIGTFTSELIEKYIYFKNHLKRKAENSGKASRENEA